MSSVLYVCVRPERSAADAEHRSFRRGLGVGSLDRLDLLHASLETVEWQQYEGFVIGGSPFNVTDAEKDEYQRAVEHDLERIARRALDGDATALFTCYGIGVVTRMLGGEVHTGQPEQASATSVQLTDAGIGDPLFGPGAPTMSVFTAHKESARETPPGAVLLATNDACTVQAYRVGERLYATQFHPEASPQDFADRMAVYRASGYFDPRDYERTERAILDASVDGHDLLARFPELLRG
ncbi:glutamine amidotransferase-related protein [Microbacterium sp. nov. GSS16]|uniref:glutamine amidotransferase-related protein n=1 Tax=Microbacterium sp. nov. GSS16 TaxID=3019890 RepID=UPI002306CEBE|nr:GMP synthase [Microbacterium sp. nov. GSS16]WCD93871.1 GMP synthase [Microbacterium sp. nov. GSS16]